jgi:mono/diheme cytochrome c family protein
MKIQNISWLMILVFAFSAPAFSSGGSSDAEALFESKCSRCHTIDRPKSKKKTEAEWKSTVMRMKNVNGCPITDEEAQTIIKYLSENYGK